MLKQLLLPTDIGDLSRISALADYLHEYHHPLGDAFQDAVQALNHHRRPSEQYHDLPFSYLRRASTYLTTLEVRVVEQVNPDNYYLRSYHNLGNCLRVGADNVLDTCFFHTVSEIPDKLVDALICHELLIIQHASTFRTLWSFGVIDTLLRCYLHKLFYCVEAIKNNLKSYKRIFSRSGSIRTINDCCSMNHDADGYLIAIQTHLQKYDSPLIEELAMRIKKLYSKLLRELPSTNFTFTANSPFLTTIDLISYWIS